MITFRAINIETDAKDIARLYSFTVAEPMSEAAARDWLTPRKDQIRITTLALDENNQAIGYWDVNREAWMKPGHFYIKVIVAPHRREQGLGTQMYEDALRIVHEHRATRLESYVRENDPASFGFAEKHGFKIEHHTFESTLDLAVFDEHRFDDLLARLQADGFRFFSLAEAGLTEENKHKLYDVNRESGLDNPGNDEIFPDYPSFSKDVFEASWFRADTQILASLAEQWVGLSAIGIYPEDNHAYNAFTGVLREFRGRGLAQALKLQTILLAKKKGMRYIRTNNDSQNAPMLAINRKLGYQPELGVYKIICTLN
jgi:RimJ/RimL family protein N-acetyltransferase